MRSARVISINEHSHFADYAEYNPRPRDPGVVDPAKPLLHVLLGIGGALAFGIGVWWFFIWAAVGGWRTVHHFVDQIVAAFQ